MKDAGGIRVGLDLGARVKLFRSPDCGKRGVGSCCSQPHLVSSFQELYI